MRLFLIALVVVSIALPAFGETHVIKVLGTEPLFGTCSSRDQFFALMRRYPERETIALNALGLDRAEFERGMRSAKNVTTGGPLHLDAMAYYLGRVKVVRDVQLPPHTKLWVSHLSHRTVYVPQLCGNISTVAVIAVGAYRAAFPVSARAGAHPTTPFAGARGPQAALATTPPVGVRPSSAESPKAVAGVPTTGGGVPSAAHHVGFSWWIFLIPVALIHGGGGSTGGGAHVPIILIRPGSSSSPSPSPSPSRTPCPSPTPKPTPCPSRSR